MKKILICGGHLSPALATIEELKKQKDVEITFVGRKHATEWSSAESAEYQLISKMKIPFYEITTGRLQRKLTPSTLPSLAKVPIGIIQAFYLLTKIKPDIVVSFGSYVSAPISAAAVILKIKSVIHEQASIPGLATKVNAKFAKAVFLTWPQSKKYFPKNNARVIGNLTRDLSNKTPQSHKLKNFLTSGKILIFMGGSQGSHILNKLVFEFAEKVASYKVVHLLGTANYKNDHDRAKQLASPNYLPLTFIEAGDYGPLLAASSVVISRAGANTVWELVVFGKPAVLIPLEIAAKSEQHANAEILESAGAAIVVEEKEANVATLKAQIEKIFINYQQYKQNIQKLNESLPKNGRRIFVQEILNLIK